MDNGEEHPFTPGTLQITRDGETQSIFNTGETELVFLGALIDIPAESGSWSGIAGKSV